MRVFDQIAFTPDPAALFGQLHIGPDSPFAPELTDLVARAAEVARPKLLLAESYIEARGEDTVQIDGITFTSHTLRSQLSDIDRVFPYVATCGTELDALLGGKGDGFMRFALDCIKQSALSAAMAFLREYLTQVYGLEKIAMMNPGSGDADVWPIEEQVPLFRLLGDVEGVIGVRLTESMLMSPNKTVSGIMYPTERDFAMCQLCHREDCPNRRAPFDEHLWLQKEGAMGRG